MRGKNSGRASSLSDGVARRQACLSCVGSNITARTRYLIGPLALLQGGDGVLNVHLTGKVNGVPAVLGNFVEVGLFSLPCHGCAALDA